MPRFAYTQRQEPGTNRATILGRPKPFLQGLSAPVGILGLPSQSLDQLREAQNALEVSTKSRQIDEIQDAALRDIAMAPDEAAATQRFDKYKTQLTGVQSTNPRVKQALDLQLSNSMAGFEKAAADITMGIARQNVWTQGLNNAQANSEAGKPEAAQQDFLNLEKMFPGKAAELAQRRAEAPVNSVLDVAQGQIQSQDLAKTAVALKSLEGVDIGGWTNDQIAKRAQLLDLGQREMTAKGAAAEAAIDDLRVKLRFADNEMTPVQYDLAHKEIVQEIMTNLNLTPAQRDRLLREQETMAGQDAARRAQKIKAEEEGAKTASELAFDERLNALKESAALTPVQFDAAKVKERGFVQESAEDATEKAKRYAKIDALKQSWASPDYNLMQDDRDRIRYMDTSGETAASLIAHFNKNYLNLAYGSGPQAAATLQSFVESAQSGALRNRMRTAAPLMTSFKTLNSKSSDLIHILETDVQAHIAANMDESENDFYLWLKMHEAVLSSMLKKEEEVAQVIKTRAAGMDAAIVPWTGLPFDAQKKDMETLRATVRDWWPNKDLPANWNEDERQKIHEIMGGRTVATEKDAQAFGEYLTEKGRLHGGAIDFQAVFDALPSGAEFVGPDGVPRRKP